MIKSEVLRVVQSMSFILNVDLKIILRLKYDQYTEQFATLIISHGSVNFS